MISRRMLARMILRVVAMLPFFSGSTAMWAVNLEAPSPEFPLGGGYETSSDGILGMQDGCGGGDSGGDSGDGGDGGDSCTYSTYGDSGIC